MIKSRPYLLAVLLTLSLLVSRPLLGATQAVDAPVRDTDGAAERSIGAKNLSNAPQSKEFRRGYQGYDGVTDTYLKDEASPSPHGAEGMFHVKESGGKRGLVRFDVTLIPHYMEVTEARLEIFLGYRYPETTSDLRFYHLRHAWSEAGATWATTGMGDGWASPGAGMAGSDYDPDPFAVATLSAGNGYKSVDVTAAVQRWVSDPAGNHGFLILGTNIETQFWASDSVRETERPRLLVTYVLPPDVTPEPTYTLTPTRTATPEPSATPTPANIIYSTGWAQAFAPDEDDPDDLSYLDCIEAGPANPPSNPDSTDDVLLVWQGVPTSASLSFRYANNSGLHSVSLNGERVGRLDSIDGSPTCNGGSQMEIAVRPELVRSGRNTVSIEWDGGAETRSWSLQDARIKLAGIVQATHIISVPLQSSYDQTLTRAMIQTPIGYSSSSGAPNLPLVIAFHGWGGRDFDALMWLAQAANDRGWLLAAPDTRGDNQHTASLLVQSDVIDLIDYMVASPEYKVDLNRIYLVGTSMGGMMATTVAAKYPDRFAALAELKGPTRLDEWYDNLGAEPKEAWRQPVIAKEMGGPPGGSNAFAYERASARAMAQNLRNLPILIIHGTSDRVVRYEHASSLYAALEPYGNVAIYPYEGGHPDNHPDWDAAAILNFLGAHSRTHAPTTVAVRTDESKAYYWLGISGSRRYLSSWISVDANHDPNIKVIEVDVRDEANGPVDLTFDLYRLGLPVDVAYTVEDMNIDTGDFGQYTVAPVQSSLSLGISSDHHRLVIYPHAAPLPDRLVLRQGEQSYTGVDDTYIEDYPTTANHANDASLLITSSARKVPLLRFDLSPIPPEAVLKAAQLRLYASGKWDPQHNIKTSVYRLRQSWDVSQATWNERQSGVSWGLPGARAQGADYDSQAYASEWFENPGWYQYNVTDLVRDWRTGQENLGLVLRSEQGNGTFTLSSSENPSNRPELIIQYSQPTVTPTTWITPTPTATATVRASQIYLPCVLK